MIRVCGFGGRCEVRAISDHVSFCDRHKNILVDTEVIARCVRLAPTAVEIAGEPFVVGQAIASIVEEFMNREKNGVMGGILLV